MRQEEVMRNIYDRQFDSLVRIVDSMARRGDIDGNVADDIINLHDPRGLSTRHGGEIDRAMQSFMGFMDTAVDRMSNGRYRLTDGNIPGGLIDDAVLEYIQRTARSMGGRSNYGYQPQQQPYGGYDRGSDRSMGGSGIIRRDGGNSGHGWSSSMGMPRQHSGNPLEVRGSDASVQRLSGYQPQEREQAPPQREVEREAPPALFQEELNVPNTDIRPTEFKAIPKDELPAFLAEAPSVSVTQAFEGEVNFSPAHAGSLNVHGPVASEETVLKRLSDVVRHTNYYLFNVTFTKLQTLAVDLETFGSLRGTLLTLDHNDPTGTYWRKVNDTLENELKSSSRKQVETIIVEEFNKRLISLLRNEVNLDWSVSLNRIEQIGDLIIDDDIPDHFKKGGMFLKWCNRVLGITLSEIFGSEVVRGNSEEEKANLCLADGDYYLNGRTLAEAAVQRDDGVWATWIAEYRKNRTVIKRRGSLVVSNIGGSENIKLPHFDVDRMTQGTQDFWCAYTTEGVTDASMADMISRGQKNVYLADGGRGGVYTKFNTLFCTLGAKPKIVLSRKGYEPNRLSPLQNGHVIIS